jgi:phage-related protein
MTKQELGEKIVSFKLASLITVLSAVVCGIAFLVWYGAVYANKVDNLAPRVDEIEKELEEARITMTDVKYIKESITEIKDNLQYLMRRQ